MALLFCFRLGLFLFVCIFCKKIKKYQTFVAFAYTLGGFTNNYSIWIKLIAVVVSSAFVQFYGMNMSESYFDAISS